MSSLRLHKAIVLFLVLFLSFKLQPGFAQDSSETEFQVSKGLQSFHEREYNQAADSFRKAVEADPSYPPAHYYLGITYLQQAVLADSSVQRTRFARWAHEELKNTQLLDPSSLFAGLDAAKAEMILGRFDEAQEALKSYLESKPDDPAPYLFLAAAQYRRLQDRPELAQEIFENLDRAAATLEASGKENTIFAQYIDLFRGLTERSRNPNQAKQYLQRVLVIDPNSMAGRRAAGELESIDRSGEFGRRPWDLSLQLGFDWDTNVVLRGRNVRTVDKDTSDLRFGLATNFTYRFVDSNQWLVGAGTHTFNSWHTDIKDFNVQTYGGNFYTSYIPPSTPWLSLGFRYDFEHSLIDNETFLIRNMFTPQVNIEETPWTRSTIFYRAEISDYRSDLLDARLDRDGTTHALGFVQGFDLYKACGRTASLELSFQLENVSTDGTEFEGNNRILGLRFSTPLPKDFAFDFAGEWEFQDYDNRSLLDRHRRRRDDLLQTYMIAFSKRFTEKLTGRFQIVYSEDDSNVIDRRGRETFSYDRVVYGLTFIYQF